MPDHPVIAKGSFYVIRDAGSDLILEDRTKRGLTPKERSLDERLGVAADKGTIYDMDGIGHSVPIRWYFAKDSFGISDVDRHAQDMERRYAELRELTCPD